MIVLAGLAFGLSFWSFGIMLFPILMTLFLFGISLGILACALVLRVGPAAEWFIWPIPALVSPFVGVLYPLSTLPVWMRFVSYALPPSYVFEAMRAMVTGQTPSIIHLVVGLGLAVLYIFFSYWVFAKTYRMAVRGGLIARYTAETVS